MPFCEIDCPRGLLSDSEMDRIAERVSSLMLEMEGLPDTPAARSICLLKINECDPVFLGGVRSDQGKIVVRVHLFADALTPEGRNGFQERVTRIVTEEHPESGRLGGRNVWCILCPLGAGDFAVAGRPVTLEETRAFVTAGAVTSPSVSRSALR